MKSHFLLFVSLLIFSASAVAEEIPSDAIVWGGLVRGSNQQLLAEQIKVDDDLATRLKKAFAYSDFELKGEHTQLVFREYDSWVVPSSEMYLRIDSKGQLEDGSGMSLHLQLWRDTDVLVKTDAILKYDSPLFITGPKWGSDQLFFILELREKPESSEK
ncbi:MAG: hypothetical protein ACI8UO_002367 [Verrucomicrobiales bacterium]